MWPDYRGAEPGLPGSAPPPTFRLGRTPWRPDLPWPVGLAPPGRLVASRRVAVLGKSVRVLVVHQRMHAGRPPTGQLRDVKTTDLRPAFWERLASNRQPASGRVNGDM